MEKILFGCRKCKALFCANVRDPMLYSADAQCPECGKWASPVGPLADYEYEEARRAWVYERAGEMFGKWGPDFDGIGTLNRYFNTGGGND